MTINVTPNYFNAPLGTITYMNNIYTINFALNDVIYAVYNGGTLPSTIHVKFGTIGSNAPFYTTETPMCMITLFSNDILTSKHVSYKVYNALVGAEVYRIILAKDYYAIQPLEKYNFKVYDILTSKDYKYPQNYIYPKFGVNYSSGTSEDRDAYNLIKTKYNNNLKFSIKRVFQSPTGNEIITTVSQPQTISVISGSEIPKELRVKSFNDDKIANNLTDFFIPKYTKVYFYKLTDTNISYDYSDPKMISVSNAQFKLKNNATSMFGSNVEFNHLNTVEKVSKNTYTITFFTQTQSDLNSETIIPFSQIYNLL